MRAARPSGHDAVRDVEGAHTLSEYGMRLVIVRGSGHHLQNDLQRDIGAKVLLDSVLQC